MNGLLTELANVPTAEYLLRSEYPPHQQLRESVCRGAALKHFYRLGILPSWSNGPYGGQAPSGVVLKPYSQLHRRFVARQAEARRLKKRGHNKKGASQCA